MTSTVGVGGGGAVPTPKRAAWAIEDGVSTPTRWNGRHSSPRVPSSLIKTPLARSTRNTAASSLAKTAKTLCSSRGSSTESPSAERELA